MNCNRAGDLNYRQENRDWWGTGPEAEAAYAKGDKQDFQFKKHFNF